MFGKRTKSANSHEAVSRRDSRKSSGSPVNFERLEERQLLSGTILPASVVRNIPGQASTTATVRPVAPVIAAIANATVNAGTVFTYHVTATGTPAPTFSLTTSPSGMVIDKVTGVITWTPTVAQTGVRSVTVKASNSAGSNSKSFKITVTNYVPPVISTPPAQSAVAGATFTFQMTATGTPAPAFSLGSAPSGMTITPDGIINWSPDPSLLGTNQSVTVLAANAGGTASSTFAVTVIPDTVAPTAPSVTVGPITTVDSIPLSFTATDNVGVAGYRVFTYTPAVYKGHSGRGGGYRLVSPAKFTLIADNITSNDYTITGLTPDSTYRYVVAAYDAAGNQSPYSAVAMGTTLSTPTFYWEGPGSTQNPPLTVVANHSLTFYLFTTGNETPTLSMLSAPDGAVYTPEMITNSQLTFVIAHVTWTPTSDQVGVNYITMEADNSVGSYQYSIPVTVTPDTPQISVSLNGGITYTAGQFASGQSNYQVDAIPGFGNDANPQYALSDVPFNFQVSSDSNSEPTTYALVSGPDGMTLDPDTGAGTWTPAKEQAGNTSVVIIATNTAGTSTLELSFPTYFTGAPGTPVADYFTSTSGLGTNNPTLTWTPPADTVGIAGYLITVTDAHTNAITTFDTLSTDTSYTLSGLGAQQYFVTVTPYNAAGNLGIASAPMSIYGAAMPIVSWNISAAPTVGTPLTVQFTPNNGLTYSIVAGPADATIDPATGLLTWTPTDSGNYTFVVAGSSVNGWGTVDAVLNLVI